MQGLKARLEAFQHSRVGLLVKKVMDDRSPNLAALLAWGTLSALLPLILGVVSVAGLLLRDPQRLDDVYNTLQVLIPAQAAGPVGDALQRIRETSAAPAGIVALLLLLFNGSGFFANMASVFDQVYHVESRNFVMQRLVAVAMLIVTTLLIVISSLASAVSSVIGSVPLGLSIGPTLAMVASWAITLVSVLLLFVLIYKILPNASQGWRDILPGALLSSVLFIVISMIFPLYVGLFPPNQAYAVFGVFLVFTFWLYLLGWVLVLGAELNAFLREPSQTTALAEATAAAQQGRADYDQRRGHVQAEVHGSAPAMQGGNTLGSPRRPADGQSPTRDRSDRHEQHEPRAARGGGIGGRVLGFIGLLVAVVVLRGQGSKTTDEHAHA
jgi:membrane protein